MAKSDYQQGVEDGKQGDAVSDLLDDGARAIGEFTIGTASKEYWRGVERGREIREERRDQERAAAKAKPTTTHDSGYSGSYGGYGDTSSSGPGIGTFIVVVVVIIALLSMCTAPANQQGRQVAPAAPTQVEPTVAPRAPEALAEDEQKEEVEQSSEHNVSAVPPQQERLYNQFAVPLNPVLDSVSCFTAVIHQADIQPYSVNIKWVEKSSGYLFVTLYNSFPEGTYVEVFPCGSAPVY